LIAREEKKMEKMKKENEPHDASYPYEHESTYAPSMGDSHEFGRSKTTEDPGKPYDGEYVPSGKGDGVAPKPATTTEYPGKKNEYEIEEKGLGY
jgi:hypothetical protein